MPRRLLVILVAVVVGVVFTAGLFIPGQVGGGLLALTDVVLITLAVITWPHLRPRGRPLRLVVIAAVTVIAAVKLVGG